MTVTSPVFRFFPLKNGTLSYEQGRACYQRVCNFDLWPGATSLVLYPPARMDAAVNNLLALLLLYDVTNRKSFDNTRAWLAEINEYAHRDVIIMLLGSRA